MELDVAYENHDGVFREVEQLAVRRPLQTCGRRVCGECGEPKRRIHSCERHANKLSEVLWQKVGTWR
jgi:hypothetical protein